jgi:hypothetical protein
VILNTHDSIFKPYDSFTLTLKINTQIKTPAYGIKQGLGKKNFVVGIYFSKTCPPKSCLPAGRFNEGGSFF